MSRWWAVVVVGAVLVMCAPSGIAAAHAARGAIDDPFGVGVTGALGSRPLVPLPLVAVPMSSGAVVAMGFVDDRARPTHPHGQDLAVTRTAPSALNAAARRSATALTDATPPPSVLARDGSVTAAALAVGAPEVSRRGGISPAVTSNTGSGGSGSATVGDPLALPVDDGVPLPRLTDRAAEMHASIRPLVRPG